MTDYPASTTSANVKGLQTPKIVKVKTNSKPKTHTMGPPKK